MRRQPRPGLLIRYPALRDLIALLVLCAALFLLFAVFNPLFGEGDQANPAGGAAEAGAGPGGKETRAEPDFSAQPSRQPDARPARPEDKIPPGKPENSAEKTPPAKPQDKPSSVSYNGSLEELGARFQAKYGKLKPQLWGETLPGITLLLPHPRAGSGTRRLALTLDACGGPKGKSYDAGIISLLREHQVPATIFVTSQWLKNNKETAIELAQDPLFTLEAHGFRHRPCSVNGREAYGVKGTSSIAELVGEVEANVREIERLSGRRPLWFRSGTAFYDEVAVEIIHELGLGVAGYTVSLDEGATLPARTVAQRLLTAQDGAILLAHMNHPEKGTGKGLAQAIPKLKAEGVEFVVLD